MSKDVFGVIRGELHWAKIVGNARPHDGLPKYDRGPYWSVDVTPDEKGLAFLTANGLEDKLRTPKAGDTRTKPFISLRVLENRSDGKKNDPPNISDASGAKWDGANIGNGSIGDVKVKVKDYGPGSEKGLYLQAVRVLKHIPYEVNDFAPLSEDDEFFAGSTEPETETPVVEPELDDDIPF